MRLRSLISGIVVLGLATLPALGATGEGPTPAGPVNTPVVGPGGWEMTTYYVGFLFRGPKWTSDDTPETRKLQEEHMANIGRMGKAGKLVIAGPFTDKGDLRGLYVFRVDSAEEAKALVESDPAVKAGRLRFELHPWFAAKNITVTPRKNETK
jgi:uncharacterized protein YciI